MNLIYVTFCFNHINSDCWSSENKLQNFYLNQCYLMGQDGSFIMALAENQRVMLKKRLLIENNGILGWKKETDRVSLQGPIHASLSTRLYPLQHYLTTKIQNSEEV